MVWQRNCNAFLQAFGNDLHRSFSCDLRAADGWIGNQKIFNLKFHGGGVFVETINGECQIGKGGDSSLKGPHHPFFRVAGGVEFGTRRIHKGAIRFPLF